jgi:hypothetical protein
MDRMLRTLLPALAFVALAFSVAPAGAQGPRRAITDKVLADYVGYLQARFEKAAHGLPFTNAETFPSPSTAQLSVNILPSGKVVVTGLKVSDGNLRRAMMARFSSLVMRPPSGGETLRVGVPIVFD